MYLVIVDKFSTKGKKHLKRVLKKNRFTKEGVLRTLSFEFGKWWDASIYSILH